jgi:uncharacterized phage protein (TIGR02218 family)
MLDAPSDVASFLATRPTRAAIANLFTFNLLSGPVWTFTDKRRPLKVAGVTYLPGPPRLVRGTISTERGMSVSTMKVTFQEANAEYIGMIARGFLNRAVFTLQRQFATNPGANVLTWTSPFTRFAGRVNSIDSITSTSAEITIKSMLDDLDQDYPRDVVQTDCNRVLGDAGCGINLVPLTVTATASAGCTVNKLLSGLSNPDVYFTQGVVTFTSGANSGLSWMVKSYAGGVIAPSYPFLSAPVAGDTFKVTPGCDKTLATCISKYGYAPSGGLAPHFRGMPFVPDPTVTY